MMKGSGRVLLATIGAAHGVRGEVRVKSYASEPLALSAYGALHTADGRELRIDRMRPAKGVTVVKFRGVEDRETAEALNGEALFVERSRLPEAAEDEYYHADLIGLAAMTNDGEGLGRVTAVHDFGAGDMLEITRDNGPSMLTPFTREAAPVVDLVARRIIIVPPSEYGDIQHEAQVEERRT